jgi:hypothetical protein
LTKNQRRDTPVLVQIPIAAGIAPSRVKLAEGKKLSPGDFEDAAQFGHGFGMFINSEVYIFPGFGVNNLQMSGLPAPPVATGSLTCFQSPQKALG